MEGAAKFQLKTYTLYFPSSNMWVLQNNLLPHPDGPTKAVVLPDGTCNDNFLSTWTKEKH